MSLIRVYPQHWFSPRNAQQPEQSFQPLDRLHHDIDRLFNGFFTPGWPTSLMDKPQADIRPSLDIHSDDKAYTIHMEVPGVDPDEVKVEVRDGMLTVEGEKKMESCAAPAAEGEKAEAKEPVCHVQERVYGSFCRQIGLAEDADVENISASPKNGVLTIVIPRKQPEAPAALLRLPLLGEPDRPQRADSTACRARGRPLFLCATGQRPRVRLSPPCCAPGHPRRR